MYKLQHEVTTVYTASYETHLHKHPTPVRWIISGTSIQHFAPFFSFDKWELCDAHAESSLYQTFITGKGLLSLRDCMIFYRDMASIIRGANLSDQSDVSVSRASIENDHMALYVPCQSLVH